MPPSGPSGSGCLSLERDGLQPANSVLSFVLCAVLAVSYVLAFRVVAIPQSGLLAQVSSLWLHSGHSAQSLKCFGACASLPSPCLLVADAGICAASPLGELPLARNLWGLIIYLSSLLCCPLCFQGSPQTQLGLHFVPFPGLSSSGDEVFGEPSRCDLSPPPSLLLGFLGVQLVHLLRDVDCPEPQEVLVSKEACLQFSR